MAAATLVRDKESNLKTVGLKKVGSAMEYEFAFPLKNDDLGDTLWEMGKAYQIGILVGSSEEFKRVTEDTWMSDQVHIRLGSPSEESIYHPPYLVGLEKTADHDQPHPAKNGQKGKKR